MSTLPNEGGDAPEIDVASLEGEALDTALKGPETTETAPTEAAEGEEKPKFVPHAALHEERLKRKGIEDQNRQLTETLARITNQINAAEARRAAEEAEAARPKIPGVDEDPIGHITGKLGALEEKLTTSQQTLQQQAEAAAWNNYVQQDRQQFTAQNPDFETAASHLVQNRTAMYQAMGLAPHEVQQALNADAQNVAMTARARGQSPHQMIYNLAVAAGYRKADAAPPPEETAAKLATIAKGQETTRTAGAGKAKASLTPQDLLNMSPADFDKHWDAVMRG